MHYLIAIVIVGFLWMGACWLLDDVLMFLFYHDLWKARHGR